MENISTVVVLAQVKPGTPQTESGTLLVEPACSVAFTHDPLCEGVRARPVAPV
jgi:hypothetical protein